MKRHDDTLTSISFRVLPRIKEALRRRAMQRGAHMKRRVTLGEVARDVLSIGLDLTEVPESGGERVVPGDVDGAERKIRAIVREELDGNGWRFADPRVAADRVFSRVLETFGFEGRGCVEEDQDWYLMLLLLSVSAVLDGEENVAGLSSLRGTQSNMGPRRWVRQSERTDLEDDYLPDVDQRNGKEPPLWPEE